MKKIVVIGAGASGLVSAIYAKNEKNEVILVEKNDICGKKILATGNGRCNFWNEDQSLKHYRSSDKQKLKEVLKEENLNEILNFFKTIGIEPKIKNGYYYPFSNQAISVQKALILEAQKRKVKIITNSEVIDIMKTNNKFNVVLKNNESIKSDMVILSTGSKSAPKTGSNGWGYEICRKFNHIINKPLPALVQLRANEKYLKDWEGIRAGVLVELYENGKNIASECGEIQLTNYGISGICVFNLSGRVSRGLEKNKNEKVKINFLNGLNIKNKKEFIEWMNKRSDFLRNRNICESLEGILNYKLVRVLLNLSDIKFSINWNEISDAKRDKLASNLVEFAINITETNSFDKAQVCTGGVPLSEIDTNTMKSMKVENFYITGELLDVDGDCGGYNLEWAWITGMIAGSDASKIE